MSMGIATANRRRAFAVLAILAATLSVGACGPKRAPLLTPSIGNDTYEAAVRDAPIYRPAHEHDLRSIPHGLSTVDVVTWTQYPDTYRQSPVRLDFGDVWVTLEPEVKERCR